MCVMYDVYPKCCVSMLYLLCMPLFVYIQTWTLVNCAEFCLGFPCDLCEAESVSQNEVGVFWCHGI